jgi:cellulose synthase/poly-beta-1,6-N-acetylglucosamine synthase-like glycosyltransferase
MFELQWLIANSRFLEPAIREVLNAIHSFSLATHQFLILPVLFFSIIFYLLAIASIFIKPARRKNKKVEEWPFVTIQIPTFNEPVAIRCAEKCLEMDYPEDRFEIIIGDDSNDPKVSKLIDDFAKKHKKVKVVRRGTNFGFKAGNLNNMLKYSKGDIIVVFDSDFIPKKDFLKNTLADINNN